MTSINVNVDAETQAALVSILGRHALNGNPMSVDQLISEWAKTTAAAAVWTEFATTGPDPEFTEPPEFVTKTQFDEVQAAQTHIPDVAAPAQQPAVSDPQPTRVRRTKEQIQAAHDAVLARYRATLAAGISQPLSLEAAVREGTVQKLSRKVVEELVSRAVVADEEQAKLDAYTQRVQDIVTNEQPPNHDLVAHATDGNGKPVEVPVSQETVDDMFASFLAGE